MKKSRIVFLSVTGIILIAIAVLYITQTDNIKALMLAMRYSDEEIENKITENDDILKKYLDMQSELEDYSAGYEACKEIGSSTNNDLDKQTSSGTEVKNGVETTTENNDHGEKKSNDVYNQPDNNTDSHTADNGNSNNDNQSKNSTDNESGKQDNNNNHHEGQKNSSGNSNSNDASSPPESSENSKDKKQKEIISRYINKMMAVKLEFTGYLSDLEKQVYDDYSSLKENERDLEHKKNIILKYYNYVADLEKKCDDKVNELTVSMKKELDDLKLPTDVVDDIKKVYENEKSLKKAYYINLYKNGK